MRSTESGTGTRCNGVNDLRNNCVEKLRPKLKHNLFLAPTKLNGHDKFDPLLFNLHNPGSSAVFQIVSMCDFFSESHQKRLASFFSLNKKPSEDYETIDLCDELLTMCFTEHIFEDTQVWN